MRGVFVVLVALSFVGCAGLRDRIHAIELQSAQIQGQLQRGDWVGLATTVGIALIGGTGSGALAGRAAGNGKKKQP